MYRRSYVQNTIATMIMLSFIATSIENQFIINIKQGDQEYYVFKALDTFFTVTNNLVITRKIPN